MGSWDVCVHGGGGGFNLIFGGYIFTCFSVLFLNFHFFLINKVWLKLFNKQKGSVSSNLSICKKTDFMSENYCPLKNSLGCRQTNKQTSCYFTFQTDANQR